MPDNFALEPENNILLITNGIDPALRWDGFQPAAEPAGVLPPLTALAMSVSGIGNIVGQYFAYSRFLDRYGNPSNLSPVSAQLDAKGGRTIQVTGASNSPSALISAATNATPINCTSAAHGRATGQILIITGGLGNTAINGVWAITVTGVNNFTLNGSAGNGVYTANSARWKLSQNITITTAVPHNIQVGAAVVITGVTGNTDANGTWLVTSTPTATTFQINQPSGGNANYTGGGIVTTGTFGLIIDATPTTPIIITSNGHGLTTGLIVKVTGVQGNSDANGTWTITVQTPNTFALNGSSGVFGFSSSPQAIWTSGALTINYTNFPLPVEPKVVRRQILRNLDGEAGTFYVDVDTTSLLSTTATSIRSDSDLSAQEAVPFFDAEGHDIVNIYTIPPNWKAFAVAHQDRMFYFGEVPYAEGNVQVTLGSPTVTGINTVWPKSLAGRFIYIDGAPQSYEIDSVDPVAQTLTLTENAGLTSTYAFYSIRPAPAERRLLYWCCDEKTEILTKRGWLKYHEVNQDDEALSINPSTNQIEWNEIDSINIFDFDGELNHWSSSRFDAMTTDDHRWLCKGAGIIGGHWTLRQGKKSFSTTANIQNMNAASKYLIAGGGDPVSQSPIYDNRFVEVAGWYITDGTTPKVGRSIRVYQSVEKTHYHRIKALARSLCDSGCTVRENPSQNMGWSSIASFDFSTGIGSKIREMCPGKLLTPQFLTELSSSQLRLLFETMIDGDGTRHKNGGTPIFGQKNKATTDAFQMLCAMLGMRSFSRWRDFRFLDSFRDKSKPDCGLWQTTAYRKETVKAIRLKKERVRYVGKVWCPTTKNGTWMARRNGCTYWTGNSEPGKPEAVPSTNAVSIEENGDDFTGGMSYRSFIYLIERRHIHRLTFQADPGADGTVYMAKLRGCINNRCKAITDDGVYMMDEQGIHLFDGGEGGGSVSDFVQSFFRDDAGSLYHINWAAQRFFHCLHFQTQGIIRWFVALSGDYLPRHALTYSYLKKRWWVEEFKVPVGSSCVGRIGPQSGGWGNGIEQTYLGSECRRVLGYWVGNLDGETGGTNRGTATGSSWTTLVDSLASFLTDVVGLPVTISGGRGKGQTRVIAGSSQTVLTLSWPWSVVPDDTSTYQIGGVPWAWDGGSRQLEASEADQQRSFDVSFIPVLTGGMTFDMRRFVDMEEEPEDQASTFTSEQQMGVATKKNDPDMVVDLTKKNGYAQKKMSGRREESMDGIRRVSLELRGVTGPEQVTIVRLTIEGAEQ